MKMIPKSDALSAAHETASDLFRVGLMDKATMQTFDRLCLKQEIPAYSAEEIRTLRTRLNISQAVLASVMNVSANSVQKWERGSKKPSGSALKLLSLLDRKGIEAVM